MWPIIEWPGRTARPSTCQSRTSDSQAWGSVNPPCSRTVSTKRDSCVVVATYAHTMPPGTQRAGRRVEAVPGREHVEDDPVGALARRRQRLGEVAEREAPGRVVAAEELRDVGAGDVGELLASLVRRHPAVRPDRAQQRAGERAGPDAGLDHVGPGKMSAMATICAASLG